MPEPDDETRWPALTKRRVWILLLLVVFVGGAIAAGWWMAGAQTSDPYDVTSGATYAAEDPVGPTIHLGEDLENATVQDPFEHEHEIHFDQATWVRSEGYTEASLLGFEPEEWTYLGGMDVDGTALTVGMPGKQNVTIEGGADQLGFRSVEVDDGSNDLEYEASSEATLTLEELPADETVVAWSDDGTRLDWTTSDGDGEATFSLPAGTHDVEIRTASEPSAVDATATPVGTQSELPEEFAVDIEHDDFPATDVDVEFVLNGETLGTDTVTDAGTASTDVPDPIVGGEQDWHVVMTDDYGHEVNSSTYTFSTPDTLEIRNETAPDSLVTDAEVDITFYFGSNEDEIIERNTSDGHILMEGLPVDQSFIATADAEGYRSRRIYIRSLADEEQIFLLPEEEEYVDLTFDLEDFTGDYPEADTVLEVERNIDGDWRTVVGDFFGATGEFNAELAHNERYRLTLINTETGDERVVGTLTPTSSGVQTIRVLDSETELVEDVATIQVDPQIRTLPATDSATVTATVDEGGREIDQWTVTATYRHQGNETVLLDELRGGPGGGTVEETFDLRDMDGGTVIVDVDVTFEDGETTSQRVRYRVSEYYEHDSSLWAILTSAPGILGIDGGGMTLVAVVLTMIGTTALAGLTPMSTEAVGITAVAFVIVFAVFGWVGWELVIASGATLAAMWGIWRGIR